jgi:hypothetical protein
MASLALAFVFIFELILSLVLLWHWITMRDRLKKLDERLAESLDDQDLLDFQERVSGLLGEVREAGQSMASQIEQRRAALDREIARARETEKHLVHKIESFGREQEKAKAKFETWTLALGKKISRSRPVARTSKPLKLSLPTPKTTEISPILKRESRPAQAQVPQLPASTRYQKVYEMADQGFSRQEICKACGYLAGEVELILNLRPRAKG